MLFSMEGNKDTIRRFRDGDEEAVRSLYQQYGGAVLTIARSMINDRELCQEIVQQTFLKAWRAASSFDEGREFSPWLYSIARRTTIDALRQQQRSPQAQAAMGDSSDQALERLSKSDPMTFERTWEVFEIRQQIDRLPEIDREVIRLSHLVGLSHPEIAERLGIPIGTVKSRSSRGLKRLALTLRHLDHSASSEPAANQRPVADVKGSEE